MIKEAVAKLVKNEEIGYDMAKTVMDEIMSVEASDILKSAYMTALSQKGETIEELSLIHIYSSLKIESTQGFGSCMSFLIPDEGVKSDE